MNNKKGFIMTIFGIIGIVAMLFIVLIIFSNWNSLIGAGYSAGKDALEISKSDCISKFNQFISLNPNAKCNSDACIYKLQPDSNYHASFRCGRLYVPK